MRVIATNGVEGELGCVSVGHNHEPCKTAEPIEMRFGLCPRNLILDGVHIPPTGKDTFGHMR